MYSLARTIAMLKVSIILLLVYLVSSGYTARVPVNNEDSIQPQKTTTTSSALAKSMTDTSKALQTSGSDDDMGDAKTDEDSETDDDTKSNNETVAMPDMLAIMAECNNSFRLEMSYLESLNNSGSFPDESDRTPKCFFRCLLEMSGIASMDAEYDPELAAMIFAGERAGKPMDNLQDITTNCAENRKESCKCERAYQFMKCLMETEIMRYEQ